MERALPSSIDYTKILPIAAGNPRVMRRTFLPVNGQSFNAEGNNIIRIEISANQFWDAMHSYLRFEVVVPQFQGAMAGNDGTFGFDFGGGHGFIRRLRLEQAGSIIMDCNRYDRLLSAILLPSQGDANSIAHRSISENCRYNNTGTAAAPTTPLAAAATNGAVNAALCNSDGQVNPAPAALLNTFQFSIPLVGGLFSQSKLVPLQLLSSAPLTIEIELAPPVDVGVVGNPPAGVNPNPLPDYTLQNIRYIASLVDVSPDVDAQVRMVQEMSGGNIVLNSTDYTHFNGNIPANATGQQAINVPARRKSMKSIFFVGASTTFANAGAGALDTASLLYNQSFGGHFGMTDYHVKIGSIQYPATPVQCNFGNINAPFTRGEALMELSKCFGVTGSTIGTGILNTLNYASTSCATANMPGGSAAAVAANRNFYRFAPFGLDLEAFQRTAIESGVNTADRSTPITLIVNIGTGIAESINVDAYVSFDSLYFIDSSGIISVSH
jgi:hypothetical protein